MAATTTSGLAIEDMFDEMLHRPFGPSGPKFPLDPNYAAAIRREPAAALSLMRTELQSTNAITRSNAYDFLWHIARAKGPEQVSALEILRSGQNDSSFAVRKFVDF